MLGTIFSAPDRGVVRECAVGRRRVGPDLSQSGPKFWECGVERRKTHNPRFASPEELLAACVAYFDWAHSHPLYEAKAWQYQGEVVTAEVPKMRVFTLTALKLFIGISHRQWQEYSGRGGYDIVCEWARDVVRVQKFEGAAAGLLDPGFIGRDLGQVDKKEHSGPDGGPMRHEVSTPEEVRRRLGELGLPGDVLED